MGAVTQQMFYMLRAYGTWFHWIYHVVRERDDARGVSVLHVHLAKAELAAWQVFPGSEFEDRSERYSVLVTDAGLYTIELLRGLFWTWLGGAEELLFPTCLTAWLTRATDMAYTIREVAVRPRNQHLVVFHPVVSHPANLHPAIFHPASFQPVSPRVDPESPTAPHWFFRITLPDGSDYAVDFTNAQFADVPARVHRHGVAPWSDYLAHLHLTEADVITTLKPIDEGFIPQAGNGPYNRKKNQREVYYLLRYKAFNHEKRDRLAEILTRFSLLLSIKDCAIQRHRRDNTKSTIFLTEVLNSPKAIFDLYVQYLLNKLRSFLVLWRLDLRDGRGDSGVVLRKMWNMMKTLRHTPMYAPRYKERTTEPPGDAKAVDTPQSMA